MLQNLPCFCNPYFFLGVSFQQYLEHIPVPFVDKDLCNSSAHYNGHLGLSDICTGSRTDRPICKVCVVNNVILFWTTYPRVRYTKENIFSFFICFRNCGRNQNSRYAILNSGVIISLKMFL